MLKKLVWLSMIVIAAVSQRAESGVMAAQIPDPGFAAGQRWSIKSSLPTTAKAIIDRIDPWHKTVVGQVSTINGPIPQRAPGAAGNSLIGHIPFGDAVLA